MDSLKKDIEQLGALLNRLTVQVAGLNQRLKQVERTIEATNIITGAQSASPNFIVMPQPNVLPTIPDPTIEVPIEDFDLRGISSALFFHRMCQKLDNTYEDDNAFKEAQRCIQAANHFHHAWSLFQEEDE